MTFSFSAFTAGTGEMSEKELSNKFIATIQESKIEDQLTKSTEFKSCAAKSKLEVGKSGKGKENETAIAEIEKCFTDKINGQSPQQLEKLSDKMGLQSYGLVQSKAAKDITEYLSKKISKALTGVDSDEKNLKTMIENSKFKNQNVVDQSLFFKLYQTQLGKNVLLEISRFCYKDLGNSTAPANPKSFKEYWQDGAPFTYINSIRADQLKDSEKSIQGHVVKGSKDPDKIDTNGKVFVSDEDTTDKFTVKVDTSADNKDQLSAIADNFTSLDQKFSEDFFTFCSRLIKPMCNIYRDNVAMSDSSKLGAKACLTQSRLEQYRKALTKTAEYIKKIEEDPQSGVTFNIANMKVYDGKGDNSIDAITSVSSSDIMNSQSKDYKAKLENFDSSKCDASPELADCEVLIDQKQSEFEIDNVNLKMTVKNAAEIERLLALKKVNETDFKKYLEENGYADVLDAYNNNKSDDELKKLIGYKFNARKEAYLNELKNKVGSQQAADDDTKKASKADAVVKDLKQKPAEIAQLVMFNNIISSSFELKNAKGDSLGRNTSGLDREMKDAKTTGLNTAYFDGIKGAGSTTGSQTNSSNQNNSITGLQFLDSILGFEDTAEPLK